VEDQTSHEYPSSFQQFSKFLSTEVGGSFRQLPRTGNSQTFRGSPKRLKLKGAQRNMIFQDFMKQ
jgi:hypothetical protein